MLLASYTLVRLWAYALALLCIFPYFPLAFPENYHDNIVIAAGFLPLCDTAVSNRRVQVFAVDSNVLYWSVLSERSRASSRIYTLEALR